MRRGFAVADFGFMTSSGRLTWLLWLLIHIVYLAGWHNRLQVGLQWTAAFVAHRRNVRLLSREARLEPPAPLASPAPVELTTV